MMDYYGIGYGITLQGHLALHYGVIAFIHVNEMT